MHATTPWRWLLVLVAGALVAGACDEKKKKRRRTSDDDDSSESRSTRMQRGRPDASAPTSADSLAELKTREARSATATLRGEPMPSAAAPSSVLVPPELAPPPTTAPRLPGDPILHPELATASAPAMFRVLFETTEGAFSVECVRAWAPRGVDRFFNLVKLGFYDDAAFFRVVTKPRPFVVQFGLHGDPMVTTAWKTARLDDEPVGATNARGTLSFAAGGPSSRTTQVFINLGDNKYLDPLGFTPMCRVLDSGMSILDRVNAEYQGTPDQASMTAQGNGYLRARFPLLDYVRSARLAAP